jgi:hypothetical protein
LVGGENLKGICIGHCAISDVDGLEKIINNVTSEISNMYNTRYSWLIIKYEDKSPNTQ